jgi:hypothetical protein
MARALPRGHIRSIFQLPAELPRKPQDRVKRSPLQFDDLVGAGDWRNSTYTSRSHNLVRNKYIAVEAEEEIALLAKFGEFGKPCISLLLGHAFASDQANSEVSALREFFAV